MRRVLSSAPTAGRGGHGVQQPDTTVFRDQLRKAGFYSEWKGKYGDEARAILERSVGTLA